MIQVQFRRYLASALVLAAFILPSAPHAQANAWPDEAWLRAHYANRELMIPMRDGVKLFTSIYTPRDTTKASPSCSRVLHTAPRHTGTIAIRGISAPGRASPVWVTSS